jgi:hypothetical protein
MDNIDALCDSLLRLAKEAQKPNQVDEEGECFARRLLQSLFNSESKGIIFIKQPGRRGLDYFANGLTPQETDLLMRVSWSIMQERSED